MCTDVHRQNPKPERSLYWETRGKLWNGKQCWGNGMTGSHSGLGSTASKRLYAPLVHVTRCQK